MIEQTHNMLRSVGYVYIVMSEYTSAVFVVRHKSRYQIQMIGRYVMSLAGNGNSGIPLCNPIQAGDGSAHRTEIPVCVVIGKSYILQGQF